MSAFYTDKRGRFHWAAYTQTRIVELGQRAALWQDHRHPFIRNAMAQANATDRGRLF